jgi:hypothetical protein
MASSMTEGAVAPARRGIDPYEAGMNKGGKPRIISRTPVKGRIIAVLTSTRDARSLQLIHPWTRCVGRHEVHELLLTDEMDARPGMEVNRVAAICFMEFTEGGLIMGTDRVVIGGKEIGSLLGFDETHCPNHMNIVLRGPARKTGEQWGIRGGDIVEFIVSEGD